ncbi:ferritin [Breznakiella homolactica]|uniref:Ferritin n=1 Tax=Breznakiella homolactica TaxID=2798577 RepID=A0A7T8BAU0_9SPIR|nr:ferritin [Breznakiella homolactica]QQO09365.1 ferritin [Breznakiella homolactica]
MNNTVSDLLNSQIQKEMYSAYLYLQMANFYTEKGLEGFANWFYIQAQEERDHAMLFRTYLLNNNEKVRLLPVDAPKGSYADAAAPLKEALDHERFVTSSINTIYEAAAGIKDYRTLEFLNWFVKEQGEEEKNTGDLIQKYELFAGDARGLYLLDQELKGRMYSAPDLVLE